MKLFLDESQIHELIALARPKPRDYALLNLMATTGIRCSDVVRIKLTDVRDPDGEIVRVLRLKQKKTGEYVERPLRDDCRVALAYYLQSEDFSKTQWLFHYRLYKDHKFYDIPMNRGRVYKIMKAYLRGLFPPSMLHRVGAHALRRSVAKLISDKTGRIEPASRFLGHASVATTAAYIDMDGYEEKANKVVMEDLKW